MSFTVRDANPQDMTELARLREERIDVYLKQEPRLQGESGESWLSSLDGWINDERCKVLVADRDGELIGYMIAWLWQNPPMIEPQHFGMVSEMSVDGHCKQGGVGTSMLANMSNWFKSHGLQSIEVRVPRQHPIEQAFWRSVGASLLVDQMHYVLK